MATQAAQSLRTLALTSVTMIFFAANSVLARLALREDEIDGGSFTAVRILSGAVVLALLVGTCGGGFSALRRHGSWGAAFALFGYAAAFSFAYLSLDAGVGALILFGAVQITMIAVGMNRGERPRSSEPANPSRPTRTPVRFWGSSDWATRSIATGSSRT